MKKLFILLLFLTSCTPQIEEVIIEEVVEDTVEIE